MITSRIFKLAVVCAFAMALAAGLAACGGDEEAQELSFTITSQGKESSLSGPQSADAGDAEITLKNESGEDGELQLIRVEGDHTAEEAVGVLGGVMQGKPFPDWFFAAGGVGTTPGGESQTVTQDLQAGTYFAFNTEGAPPKADSVPTFEVTGDDSGDDLEADATVTAIDYGFEADNLSSGKTEVVFDNTGAQPHHLIIAPLKGDATVEDVEKALKSESGPPPFEEKDSASTAVIEGGETQLVDLNLKPGRYVMLCFISDRQGGPPHALKGMVDEVDVD